MSWQKSFKGIIKFKEPLKNHTTFRVGGAAEFFAEPKSLAELRSLVKISRKLRKKIILLGAGSNILVSDKGLKAVVVHLDAGDFNKVSFKGNILEAGSACPLGQLISQALKRNLSGLEFLSGIPGTIGGALVMNAGASGKSIGDFVRKVRVMDALGNTKILTGKAIKFGYRKSNLSKYIILGASLKLEKSNKNKIRIQIANMLERRRNTQDYSFPNAGCIFKNPQGDSAGRLIDLCGLKGAGVGRAVISRKHANFILNKGGASCEDVLRLMMLTRKKVKQRFNIDLEPEIKIWK